METTTCHPTAQTQRSPLPKCPVVCAIKPALVTLTLTTRTILPHQSGQREPCFKPNHISITTKPWENTWWVIKALGSNSPLLALLNRKDASLQQLCSEQRSVFSAHPWIRSAHQGRQPGEPWGSALLSSSHPPSNISPVRLERPTKLLSQSVCSASESPATTEEDAALSHHFPWIRGPILSFYADVYSPEGKLLI